MGGILNNALAGAGEGIERAGFTQMQAEIQAQRDAKLNEYARSMKTDVEQPFQSEEREKTLQAQKDIHHEATSTTQQTHAEALAESKRHNVETEKTGRITAEAHMKAAEAKQGQPKGALTQKDGVLHVLQPRYGGKFEGGMWFPDEKNQDVALRAFQIYEQLSSGANALAPMEAATQAAQKAEREQALGVLPIGKGAPAGVPVASAPKSYRQLWNDDSSNDEEE
jgi:hypothetical protein